MHSDHDRAPSGASTERLWCAFVASGEPRLRDRLIASYAPMVGRVVGHANSDCAVTGAMEDAIAAGFGAVIAAIERYRPVGVESLDQCVWAAVCRAVDRGAAGDGRQRALSTGHGALVAHVARLKTSVGRREYRIDCHAVANALLRRASMTAAVCGPHHPRVHGSASASVRRGSREQT